MDENVQFTAYRPRVIAPAVWYDLLAFAHLSERRPESDPEEPDPIEQVRQDAEATLGKRITEYQALVEDSRQPIPAEGVLTFVPVVAGVEFNPPRYSFVWTEAVHKAMFRLRASKDLDKTTARGQLSVYLGAILIADLQLSFRVDSTGGRARPQHEPQTARRYRRIFASYSHKDTEVVAQFVQFAKALGDEYLTDWLHLRSGEVWSEQIRQLIEQADVFQLFWSWNSIRSDFVRHEWEHALSLGRPHFIRPTYWERPLPSIPERKLPPPALARLHFEHLGAVDEAAAADSFQAPAPDASTAAVGAADPHEEARPRQRAARPSKALLPILSAAAASLLVVLAIGLPSLRRGPATEQMARPAATTNDPETIAPSIEPPSRTMPKMANPEAPPDLPEPTHGTDRPPPAGLEYVSIEMPDLPSDAVVLLDGKRVKPPFRVPRDLRRHQITVSSRTNAGQTTEFVADRDQALRMRKPAQRVTPPDVTSVPRTKPPRDVGY
jgi:hypothetical protein